jgi:SOS-response transcriptional repressor LexA
MKSAGIKSQSELARQAMLPQPTVHRVFAGTGQPSLRTIERLAEACGVSVEWLLRGGTDSAKLPVGFRRVAPADEADNHVRIRKVKLRLSAGISGFQVDTEYDEGETITIDPRWIARRGFNAARLIAIDVRGDSMEPTLYDGDTVILDTGDTEAVDGAVYAINYEGEDVIKRLVRDAGNWWLSSDNLDQRRYTRKVCSGSSCIIIGKVVRRESDRI